MCLIPENHFTFFLFFPIILLWCDSGKRGENPASDEAAWAKPSSDLAERESFYQKNMNQRIL